MVTNGADLVVQEVDPMELERKAGIDKFNENPRKGIEMLIRDGVIDNSPERLFSFNKKKKKKWNLDIIISHSIASFLFETSELSRVGIGELIGGINNGAILEAFCTQLDLSGMRYDEALRSFLLHFRLPGEAQIIDRIVQGFFSLLVFLTLTKEKP